jgi:hypothetical protein
MSASVAKVDLTGQSADIPYTVFYAVPANAGGMYQINAYTVVTQAATTSSTLPYSYVTFIDADTNVSTSAAITVSATANTVGATNGTTNVVSAGSVLFMAKAGTNIGYQTSAYASSGATPMQFALHIKLEYLGS